MDAFSDTEKRNARQDMPPDDSTIILRYVALEKKRFGRNGGRADRKMALADGGQKSISFARHKSGLNVIGVTKTIVRRQPGDYQALARALFRDP